MTAPELYQEARRRGLRLEPHGGKLRVIPGDQVPPDFADVLRQHKGELLDWLETRNCPLTPDSVPWLHVARRVLGGEFDGSDGSTCESVRTGLRATDHPLCRRALERLKNKPDRP